MNAENAQGRVKSLDLYLPIFFEVFLFMYLIKSKLQENDKI
jgi:hypothetical protein